ncbi:MAG: peptidylprolyl isomerase [Eggerthellaceae bacterium]
MYDNSGKLVTVSYTAKLDDGWLFAQATPDAPITFPCVDGMMLPEFIDTVRHMEPGQTEYIRVSPEDAFQEWTEKRLFSIERDKVPNASGLKPGDIVHLQDAEGTEYPARLVSLDGNEAVFDANHGSVAQGLNFRITLHSVRDLPSRLAGL